MQSFRFLASTSLSSSSDRCTLCGPLYGTSPRCIPRRPPLDIVTPRCIRVSPAILSLPFSYLPSVCLSLSLPPVFLLPFLQPSPFPSFLPTIARSFHAGSVPVGVLFPSFHPLCSPSLAISPSLSLEGYPLCFDQTFFSSLCPCILPRRESAASSAGHTPVAP